MTMPRETMTGRERWLAVLRREKPDRIPMDYWATHEASVKLTAHLGCATLEESLGKLHVDTPYTVGGRYIGPAFDAGVDQWGFRYVRADYGTGVYNEHANHPLASFGSVAEIEARYNWPSAEWYDYAHVAKEIDEHPTRVIRGGGSEPFLLYCQLRGIEQAFMDFIENPDIVHYCLGKLFDLAYQNTLRTFEAAGPGRVHITYVAEDMGSQEDLMFSPEQIRTFLLPGMKRMMDLVHQYGAYVFHHNDGACRKILPTLIDAGIDVLNPIQWRCNGMDREGLKRDFGTRIVFHGGVDNQYTLPFGTVAEVRREVQDNIHILGAGGGYILAPCHNIQSVGPSENVVAMYEAGYDYGFC
jgi:uroporphyrinogen decarboxylase